MDLFSNLRHAIKHKTISVASADDPTFDPDANLFLEMKEFMSILIKDVKSFLEHFDVFCTGCGVMGEVFARYPNENDPPRLQMLAESYAGKMNEISDNFKQDIKNRLMGDVLEPLVLKFTKMETIAKLIQDRRENKRDFEHYAKKVEQLKNTEKQDPVRTIRNEEKLNAARQNLDKFTFMCTEQIKYFTTRRDTLIKFEFAHFRSIQKELFQQGYEVLKDFQTLAPGTRDSANFEPPSINMNATGLGGQTLGGSGGGGNVNNFGSSTMQTPFGASTTPFGATASPFGSSTAPFGQSSVPFGQSSAPGLPGAPPPPPIPPGFGQSSAPYSQTMGPSAAAGGIAPLTNLNASVAPLPSGGFGKKGFGGFAMNSTTPPGSVPPPPAPPLPGSSPISSTSPQFAPPAIPTPPSPSGPPSFPPQPSTNLPNPFASAAPPAPAFPGQPPAVFPSSPIAQNTQSFQPLTSPIAPSSPPALPTPLPAQPPGTKYQAKYQYAATADDEISFEAGDIIYVTDQDTSGWWIGSKADGKQGIFPGSYVIQI